MNDKLLTRHFHAAWRDNRVAVHSLGDQYIISDFFSAYALPTDHPVFDSRREFPHLPDAGKTEVFSKDCDPRPAGSLHKAWSQAAPHRLTLTRWLWAFDSKRVARTLLLPSQVSVMVQTCYLDLLGDPLGLDEFLFFGTGPHDAVVVVKEGERIAMIMPVAVSTGRFPEAPFE